MKALSSLTAMAGAVAMAATAVFAGPAGATDDTAVKVAESIEATSVTTSSAHGAWLNPPSQVRNMDTNFSWNFQWRGGPSVFSVGYGTAVTSSAFSGSTTVTRRAPRTCQDRVYSQLLTVRNASGVVTSARSTATARTGGGPSMC